jgi:hypothetical protein
MGIVVLVGFLLLISLLAVAGRGADSRSDTSRFDWDAPFTPGRDQSLPAR